MVTINICISSYSSFSDGGMHNIVNLHRGTDQQTPASIAVRNARFLRYVTRLETYSLFHNYKIRYAQQKNIINLSMYVINIIHILTTTIADCRNLMKGDF